MVALWWKTEVLFRTRCAEKQGAGGGAKARSNGQNIRGSPLLTRTIAFFASLQSLVAVASPRVRPSDCSLPFSCSSHQFLPATRTLLTDAFFHPYTHINLITKHEYGGIQSVIPSVNYRINSGARSGRACVPRFG